MNICPFCAEEIQSDAKKCKHCGEWIKQLNEIKEEQKQETTPASLPAPVGKTRILKIIGWILLVIFALSFLYISVPILVIWYLFYKTDLGKKGVTKLKEKAKKLMQGRSYKKIAIRALLVVVAIMAISVIIAYPNRKPTITITEPKNNDEIQSDKVLIKGTISPSGKNVSMKAGKDVSVDNYLEIIDGKFSFEATLDKESNVFVFNALNKENESSESITIERIFTEEEKAEIERKKEEDRIAMEKQKEAKRAETEKKKQEDELARLKAEEERRLKEMEDAKEREAEEIKKQKEAEIALANEEKDFKASCTSISYNKLKKDSYSYAGENVYYKGKIEQAGSELFSEWFRISVTSMGYGYYSDTIWVNYPETTDFAEDDVVRFWGTVIAPHCYKSQAGWDICIPAVDAKYLSK